MWFSVFSKSSIMSTCYFYNKNLIVRTVKIFIIHIYHKRNRTYNNKYSRYWSRFYIFLFVLRLLLLTLYNILFLFFY
jgi:hypothetical protein